MNTIKDETTLTLEIDKSIFISYLKNVNDIKEAKEYIQNIKNKYPDATHHVSAYIVGKGGEYGHYDDDGEPSGTSGMPIFDCFRKNNCRTKPCRNRKFDCTKMGFSRNRKKHYKISPFSRICPCRSKKIDNCCLFCKYVGKLPRQNC